MINSSSPIDVSIVLPVRNEEAVLPACFAALFSCQSKKHIEVIMVDNGSSDRSREIAEKWNVRIVVDDTQGVGHARRAGTAVAQGRYVLHIDADTRLPMSYIDDALAQFAEHPELVCLGGRVVWYDAGKLLNGVVWLVQRTVFPFFQLLSGWKIGPMGNNMIFPRHIYEQTKGFDETLKFGEDADLARKLHAYGRVWLCQGLVCPVSSRRFRGRKGLFTYLINALTMAMGMRPIINELPTPKTILNHLRHTIDK